ncbi:MAG: DUF3500 domain-containing protein [Candidatus Hydrogenedentes bacterium]|nr:DUF3500 domain-containing protein [Candidatus Hydrogenedentota bacterium]
MPLTSYTDDAVPAGPLAAATRALLDALDAEQKSQITFEFNNPERLNWHYVPKDRVGITWKTLRPEQREKAVALLKVALSDKGFKKAETIRMLEPVLHELEQGKGPTRDTENYHFTVFGAPTENGTWGLRYEGHHISFNWTAVGGVVIASSPQFLGSNPAEVKDGPLRGARVLGAEEDLGRSLVKSLDDKQRAKAVLDATAPPDILTGHDREAAIQKDLGVAYAELSSEQQGILLNIIQEVAGAQPDAIAHERLAKIRATGLDAVKFAWMGGFEKGQGHYYRVQGPTFLIEYDNTQNGANHVHTVWRDFKGDFGADLLKQHYEDHANQEHPREHAH